MILANHRAPDVKPDKLRITFPLARFIDDDFEMIRKLGIEEKAKEFFDCKGSFAPVFYRG